MIEPDDGRDDDDGLCAAAALVRSRAVVAADGEEDLLMPGQNFLVEVVRVDGEMIEMWCASLALTAELLLNLGCAVRVRASAEEIQALRALTTGDAAPSSVH